MALGTLQRPVLIDAGPVQRIGVVNLLVGIEVEPALPAFTFRPRVPGNRQRLIAPAGESDQILLQWIDAEGVADRVVAELAVGAIGTHHELAIGALEEGRRDTLVVEAGIGKVTEHGGCRGVLHGELMVRTVPGPEFALVAALAAACPDVAGGNRRCSR
jgi:hypothetical protein